MSKLLRSTGVSALASSTGVSPVTKPSVAIPSRQPSCPSCEPVPRLDDISRSLGRLLSRYPDFQIFSLLFAGLVLLIAPVALAQDSDTTLRVDVKLVNVFVTVTDKTGAPVGNLTKDNFKVLEDGTPQAISVFSRESELPLSIVLAIDTSLSTKKDIKLETQSARRFSHDILRPQDAIALYQFREEVEELVPFTSDIKRIDNGIDRVHVRSATALYDAIYLGADALMKRQGRKVMVLITDGGDTVSQVKYAEALREAQIAEAIVYPIIIVPIESSAGRDLGGEHALIQIAHDTGGKYYYASSLTQLDEAFRRISQELRTQYLLAYYPSRRLADSDFRKIDVEITAPDADEFRSRHRTGYYTSKAH